MISDKKQVYIQDWGMIDYATAWHQQEVLQKLLINDKVTNATPRPNYFIFCEHPPVYTLGKSGNKAHLLAQETFLQQNQVTFFHTNRGGDITYHGPGQLILYPIVDLELFFKDIAHYLRLLEEAVIATLQDFSLSSGRIAGLTGVWIQQDDQAQARKICAIGIRISRWVTMHGLALNIDTDLSYFSHIVPCGISDSQVTSMSQELGYRPHRQLVKERLQAHMCRLLNVVAINESQLDQ